MPSLVMSVHKTERAAGGREHCQVVTKDDRYMPSSCQLNGSQWAYCGTLFKVSFYCMVAQGCRWCQEGKQNDGSATFQSDKETMYAAYPNQRSMLR